MKRSTETTNFTQMGMAALLPGMQYMLERMQRELDEMRNQLALYQGTARDAVNGQRKTAPHGGESWASMTPEERSGEMKRRQAMARAKRQGTVATTRWAKMTKKQKEEWKAKMQAGRRRAERAAKRIPVTKLAQEAVA